MGRTRTLVDRVVRPGEAAVTTFLQALGLDEELDEELDVPPRYLLLAGVPAHPSGRGPVRMRMASFGGEAEAKAAFRQLRMRSDIKVYWAEVVSLDAHDQVRRLCWFGDAWDVDTTQRGWWADTGRSEGARRRARILRHRTARPEADGPADEGGSAGPPLVRLLP